MKPLTLLTLLVIFLSACAAPAPAPPATPSPTVQPTATPAISPELRTYLDNALTLIQENSIYTENANWEIIRATVYQQAEKAQTTADLHPILNYVVHATGDRHGYVMPPMEATVYFSEPASEDSLPAIKQEIILDRIAYLSVPTFVSGNMENAVTFAGQLQGTIQSLDAQNPCGWVLDLRGNEGGNGFAMLLGVSPLLPEGTLGWYTYNGGKIEEWRTQGN